MRDLSKETSLHTSLQDFESSSPKQNGPTRNPGKENSCKTSRKRSMDNDKSPKRARMDVNVFNNNINSEFSNDVDECLHFTCQTEQYIPHNLIGLVYKLHLSVLCSLRKSILDHKYPSLSLVFQDSEIDKLGNIVLRNEKKSTHILIENIDKYYVDNGINYARLFSKEKRSFSINNYFDAFVKHLISQSDDLFNDIDYLVIYTNSGLDITEGRILKRGRFKHFYPFRFNIMKECGILKDFLYTSNNKQGSGFYQFEKYKTTREELYKRLEYSSAMQKAVKERKVSQKEIKETFLDKLVFVVNQPNREELKIVIKKEKEKMSKNHTSRYLALQEQVLRDITASEKHGKRGIIYEFNLLLSFLHHMFLHKNISSINFKGINRDVSNVITVRYKGKVAYIKPCIADNNVGYSKLFPSKKQENTFSINKYFTYFVEESLKEDIKYFIIYTDADLDLTEENELKRGRTESFYPLKFDRIEIRKCKILRNCSCINGSRLYQFVQETTREKLLSLLKLPLSLQDEKSEGFSDEQEIKERFLNRLIFAVNQPSKEDLNRVISKEIDKSTVPYDYEELHEIALRWLESHEFGSITKEIMEKILGDIKNNRSTCQDIKHKNIDEEIKFAKSVVGREGTPSFNQFLDFLVKGKGVMCLKILKKEKIDLVRMSSILHVAGADATKAFQNLFSLWFNEKGHKTQYLKTLENERINLSNMSSVLGGSGTNAAKAFKDLCNLWFDMEGNKTQYLKKLEKEGINLINMTSILSGAGANAANAFKDLYNLWFNDKGNKSRYLKTFKKEGMNLSNISGILNAAGAKAPTAFKDLYDLWFDDKRNKTQYLKTLETEGINLTNVSNILHGAGANAAKVFKDLYHLWYDTEGNKTEYLKNLENENIDLSSMSCILSGAGNNSAKAFEELCNTFFDEKGNKKKHLKHFVKKRGNEKSFTLHNLSGILGRAGASAKDAFEKLHSVCFNDKGKRTELLDDFYKAGYGPSNLSSMLCGEGVRASSTLKELHNICFNKKREKTIILENFEKTRFRPCDLCGILSGAVGSLERFHNFCFINETKKYLDHFLKGGFKPKNLSKILHGAKANICFAFTEFHDVCFDETGDKTKLLNNFYDAGFTPNDLSNILNLTGNNAASVLRNFHECYFNKKKYLNHFFNEERHFTPKDLSKILYGVGININLVFEKLHDICFDEVGCKTDYLNNLVKNNLHNEVLSILYEQVRN